MSPPTARLVHLARRRLLLGTECLKLQGISFHQYIGDESMIDAADRASSLSNHESSFPGAFLHNLAGNAFHAGCFAAVTVACSLLMSLRVSDVGQEGSLPSSGASRASSSTEIAHRICWGSDGSGSSRDDDNC